VTAALHSLETPLGKAELKAEFVRLRAKGLPYARIAERLGVAKSTLANWNAELEAEIASARAMELEALQAEFFVLKEGRITLLGEQLRRLRGELAGRDLTEVATDKLLELLLKYQAALKDEFVEVRPLSDREQARLRALGS
jgi:transcriptional regulator with XRE-family HTH domain